MFSNRIEMLNDFLDKGIKEGDYPSYSYGLYVDCNSIVHSNTGYCGDDDEVSPFNEDSIMFDIASLTKVVATTTCILTLVEEGRISLEMRAKHILPKVKCNDIRIKHLLTHTSGLQPDLNYRVFDSKDKILDFIYEQDIAIDRIGSQIVYSDLGFILLGEIIERITGEFEGYFYDRVTKPLSMDSTMFNPLEKLICTNRIAPTEECGYRERLVVGDVHDEKAFVMGGVAGHAGLFSTSKDLLTFIKCILNDGNHQGKQIIHPRVVSLLKHQYFTDGDESRTLGWITNNSNHGIGDLSSSTAIFHTGFVGTSILIDFEENFGFVLLTNRVHPSRNNMGLIIKRGRIHNLAHLCKE